MFNRKILALLCLLSSPALASNGNGGNPVQGVQNTDGTITATTASGIVTVSRPAITGDVAISGGGNVSTLATVNSNVGTFQGLTVNAKGLVTAATNQSYVTALTGVVTASGPGSSVTSFGTFTSSTLATAISDETGSGSAVFATSPTMVTPTLGAMKFTSGVITGGSLTTGSTIDLSAATNSMLLPTGTTGQRPTGVAGMLRYNSTTPGLEAYYNNLWNALGSGGGGGVSLSGNNTWTAGQATTPDTAGSCGTQVSGGTMTPNFALSNSCVMTFGAGNVTIVNPINVIAGQDYIFKLIQDGTGSRTVTWGTNIHWGNGNSAPTLTTFANHWDDIACHAWTTTEIDCALSMGNVL